MKRLVVPGIVAMLFAGSASGQDSTKPAAPEASKAEKETRYLAFQIFTYSPDPKVAVNGEGKETLGLPGRAALRDYIEDIKQRIGTVGDRQTRLAVMLGPLCFEHRDAEITKLIELAFSLALETDVAVGFHIDDSMFWARRRDLWSDRNNVEALDWEGTPCTGRRLDWGPKPDAAPPQMCFNSKVIQQEVRQRSALFGKAIQAGVKQLEERNRPELFAGVIAGWETMIGQDFKTGKSLGYRALLNRGFSREHPPQDLDLERGKVVQEFIDLWTKGLAEAGVSPQKIYSHTAFLSRRVFKLGDNQATTYSQHNHFAPPSVAFGKHHRPGFSTYPQPGLFDDIYEQLAGHEQVGWASSEGTNLQLGSGPGQSGMTMETYLAKTFNHGGTLVNIFSWGIGGEANKHMDFRVVTEGEDALRAYRTFLKGDALIEAKTEALTLLERLPPKIHRIQKELPAWIEKSGNRDKTAALMQKLDGQLKAKNFDDAEATADSLLKLMGANAEPQAVPAEAVGKRISGKVERVKEGLQKWAASGHDPSAILKTMQEKVGPLLDAGKPVEAEAELDRVLEQLGQPKAEAQDKEPPPTTPQAAEAVRKRITGKVERVEEGVQKWVASGRDPSAIAKTMQEKVGPLLDAGKPLEAEAELDRVLELLGQPKAKAQDKVPSPTGPAPPGSVWYTVGNLSVELLARAWGSPISEVMRKSGRLQELMPKAQMTEPEHVELQSLSGRLSQLMNAQRFEEASRTLDRMLALVGQRGELPEGDPRADLARARSKFLQRARAAGADGVEDYIGWAVVETKPGQWDWSLYQENAREIRKAGLKYIPSVWVQNLPSWVRQGADYRFATCLEHGKATEALSIFSPKTVEAYNRVFAQLEAALGPQIDALRIGSPSDYGETHYPAGAASRAFPVAHTHIGWWAQEPEARQHFLRWVEKRYGSIDRLNAAWGTHVTGFTFDYPRDPTSARRWLDFVEWYHEALIERLGVLFDVARKHFPKTPICVNLGWPFEKIALGQDLSGLVKMLASRGMTVRTPTGPMVTHLYTRRVATASRFYHAPRLSTEPADGSAPLGEIAGALFKDLTTGTTWHFDYLDNMERAPASFQHARSLPRHDYPRIDAAIVFSTTAHRLENWDNWHAGFQGGYPEGMASWLEGLRDTLDYDVVDERLIDDGALRNYRLLIWPFGTRVESRTMDKIRDWVEHGGTLLVRDLAAVRTVEGKPVAAPAGKGRVVDAGGSLDRLAELVRTRDPQMTGLPPLDTHKDGVITSLFDDGILLFNRNAKEATVELPMPAGRWDVDYPGLPGNITLPPLAIRWLKRQGIPEEGLRKLRHDLGGSFLVSRDKVQDELKLTKEQKEKLEQHFRELLPDAMRFFQKIEGLKQQKREKELSAYRPKAQEKLAALVKETLNEGQRTRLRQLELQREGLRDGEIWKDLQVTNEQRRQFMELIQQAQDMIRPLIEEAQKDGNPEEIQPKVIKIRDALEGNLEALLTDAQKKQWKEMLGKPMELADLFDL